MDLSEFFKFWNAKDATGVAADLRVGKTMYNDSGKITGTLGGNRGQLIDYPFPKGSTGAYNVSVKAATDALDLDTDLTIGATAANEIDTNGYITTDNATTYATILSAFSGMPAIPASSMRVHEIWGKFGASLGNNEGVFLEMNFTDGNNRWVCNLLYETGTPRFVLNLIERNTGTPTTRIGPYYFTTVDLPAQFRLALYDAGDTVYVSAHMWETDTNTDFETYGGAYYAASRFNKSVQSSSFRFLLNPYNDAFVRGVRLSDVLI